jgi:hypothetical protein
MTEPPEGPLPLRGRGLPDRRSGESWLSGGLAGIAAVTAATFALAVAGFLIALIVSLAF